MEKEIAGKNPNSLPLLIGKFPVVPTTVRTKQFRTHSSRITNGFPLLDEDAVKVDNQVNSFKKPCPSITQLFEFLGHSINASLRAASYADWLLAFTWRKLPKYSLPTVVSDSLRALALSVAHVAEFSARSHATLLLMERDAFLNRPTVQLSEELKGKARVAPLDSKTLFAGQLTELAQKATQGVQSSAWLFERNKSKLDSPKNVFTFKAVRQERQGANHKPKRRGSFTAL